MRTSFLRLVSLVLVLSSSLQAADYYVATTGSNQSTGTKNRPFQTIGRGLAAASTPGDNVIVRSGVYRPSRPLVMVRPGSEQKYITLRAFDGERVDIDGANIIPRDENDRKSLNLINISTHHVRVSGLTIRNSPHAGVSVWGPGSRVHDVDIIGNTIRDCHMSGVYVGFNDFRESAIHILVDNNTIHDCCLNNGPRPDAGISENARRLGGRNIPWGSAIGVAARHVTASNNRVYRNYGEGIGVYLSDSAIVEGNEVYDNFSVNVYLDNATNCNVRRNLIYSSGDKRFFRFKHPADGILIANEFYGSFSNPCSTNEIINNILIGNRSAFCYGAYQRAGGLRDTIFANNTAYGSTGALLQIDIDKGHKNSRIINNIFQQVGRVAMTDIREKSDGIEFRNNLWFGVAPQQPAKGKGDVFADPRFAKGGTNNADDYQIQQDSPARGAGIDIEGVDEDFGMRPRRRTNELGAWSFSDQ